ncbi:MAG: hypothetical protein RL701_973 [Pseudomonadota bacterium]|jgi:hypothetical protein
MPFTFFAHQTIVMPFKWLKPRWFDGTALCIGSMAPDFAYALDHTPLSFHSHNIPAQVVWTIPLTLLLTRLIRTRLAEPIGAQLPGSLGAEVKALGHSKHALWQTVSSAFLGGLSHIFLDGFTHYNGWAARRIAPLRHIVGHIAGYDIPVSAVLQYVGHTFGTALGVLMLARIVQRRMITHWNELPNLPVEAQVMAPVRLWNTRAWLAGLACGLVAAASGPNIPVAIIRGSLTLFAAIALASVLNPHARVAEEARVTPQARSGLQ